MKGKPTKKKEEAQNLLAKRKKYDPRKAVQQSK